eukprot:gene5078-6476_t
MWKAVEPENLPVKRLENAMAEANGKLYLVGGRDIKSVDEYDPKKNTWVSLSNTPLEMSGYPHEIPIPNIYIFNPDKNEWRKGPEIPENRRRGAA